MNALDTWVAIGSLGLAVVLNTAAFAFFMGRVFERLANHNQRLKKLETAEADEGGKNTLLALAVGRLEVELKHASSDITEIKGRINWMGSIADNGGVVQRR